MMLPVYIRSCIQVEDPGKIQNTLMFLSLIFTRPLRNKFPWNIHLTDFTLHMKFSIILLSLVPQQRLIVQHCHRDIVLINTTIQYCTTIYHYITTTTLHQPPLHHYDHHYTTSSAYRRTVQHSPRGSYIQQQFHHTTCSLLAHVTCPK